MVTCGLPSELSVVKNEPEEPFGSSSRTDCGIFMCVSPFGHLWVHSDNQLAEVVSLEHADEGLWRILQTVRTARTI
jgi:hypothetical protein